jgi:hypothetical protein
MLAVLLEIKRKIKGKRRKKILIKLGEDLGLVQ